MPPKRPSGTQADSDSDSDAPEAVSLSSSKKISEAQAKTIRLHESSQQIKKKNENRERDRLLKEEKAKRLEADDSSKKLKSKGHARMTAVEERMERAMRQAAEEDSDGEDDEVDQGTGDDDEDDSNDDSDDDDEGMDEDDEEVEEEWGGIANEDQDPDITTKQLPDHIFAAAASKLTIKQSGKSSVNRTKLDKKKKKRKENRAKELIVGDRAIKLLPSASPVGEGYQSQHINKFMKTQLQLRSQEVTVATTPSLTKRSGPVGRQKIPSKGGSKVGGRGSKDWHRIPVHLGAMRRYNGPANKFVRDAVSMSDPRP